MRLHHIFIALIVSATILSCKNEKSQKSTDNLFKFKNYISYTTSGVVSVADPININLVKEATNLVSNKEISQRFFSISPTIEGKLIALNSRALFFQPSKKLEQNKEYTVTVYLGKIYNNIPSEFKTYTFKFKTIEHRIIKIGNI